MPTASTPAYQHIGTRHQKALDDIRRRWGHNIIQRGVVMTASAFAAIKPVADHTIHPVSYFNGPK